MSKGIDIGQVTYWWNYIGLDPDYPFLGKIQSWPRNVGNFQHMQVLLIWDGLFHDLPIHYKEHEEYFGNK